jgi:hypothetical protein
LTAACRWDGAVVSGAGNGRLRPKPAGGGGRARAWHHCCSTPSGEKRARTSVARAARAARRRGRRSRRPWPRAADRIPSCRAWCQRPTAAAGRQGCNPRAQAGGSPLLAPLAMDQARARGAARRWQSQRAGGSRHGGAARRQSARFAPPGPGQPGGIALCDHYPQRQTDAGQQTLHGRVGHEGQHHIHLLTLQQAAQGKQGSAVAQVFAEGLPAPAPAGRG